MTKYRLSTPVGEEEILASDPEEARRIASARIRETCEPYDRLTYWIAAELHDESGSLVSRWYEGIDPETPPCEPPVEELAEASTADRERAWRAQAWREDRHLWARPGHVEAFCLRCGTVQYVDHDVTDPKTGASGLRAVWYRPGWESEEVRDRYHRALKWLRLAGATGRSLASPG